MGARGRMTMRAIVRRNVTSRKDPDGSPATPRWLDQADLIPCWLWSNTERTVAGDVNVVVEDVRLMVPIEADISVRDQISRIVDRAGHTVSAQLMHIRGDQRMESSHRELILEVVA